MSELPASFDLSGKAAVVTGSAGLLGSGFCRTLAEAGASVVLADNNAGENENLAKKLDEAGFAVLAVKSDITDPDSVEALRTARYPGQQRCAGPQIRPGASGRALQRLREVCARGLESGVERQPDRDVFGYAGRGSSDARSTGRRDRQHLFDLRARGTGSTHLSARRPGTGVQAGLLLGHESWSLRFHSLPGGLLCRQEHTRKRAYARRRV
jgi:hypothetical protein